MHKKKEGEVLVENLRKLTLKKCEYLLSKKILLDSEVFSILKLFFKGYFNIDYEFSFLELIDKLDEVNMNEDSKENFSNFLIDITKNMYSGVDFTVEELHIILENFSNILLNIKEPDNKSILDKEVESIIHIPFIKKLFIRKKSKDIISKDKSEKHKKEESVELSLREQILKDLSEKFNSKNLEKNSNIKKSIKLDDVQSKLSEKDEPSDLIDNPFFNDLNSDVINSNYNNMDDVVANSNLKINAPGKSGDINNANNVNDVVANSNLKINAPGKSGDINNANNNLVKTNLNSTKKSDHVVVNTIDNFDVINNKDDNKNNSIPDNISSTNFDFTKDPESLNDINESDVNKSEDFNFNKCDVNDDNNLDSDLDKKLVNVTDEEKNLEKILDKTLNNKSNNVFDEIKEIDNSIDNLKKNMGEIDTKKNKLKKDFINADIVETKFENLIEDKINSENVKKNKIRKDVVNEDVVDSENVEDKSIDSKNGDDDVISKNINDSSQLEYTDESNLSLNKMNNMILSINSTSKFTQELINKLKKSKNITVDDDLNLSPYMKLINIIDLMNLDITNNNMDSLKINYLKASIIFKTLSMEDKKIFYDYMQNAFQKLKIYNNEV